MGKLNIMKTRLAPTQRGRIAILATDACYPFNPII